MLDAFHRVPKGVCDVQVFDASAEASGVGWQTWSKPAGATMCYIFCLAGGGAGANGVVGSNNAGGGGGSSGQTSVIIPAFFLPKELFVSVGAGGVPGSGSGTAGGDGTNSRVAIYPDTTANNCLATATAGKGSGGGTGGPLAGVAGTIATIATMPLASLGVSVLIAGQAGSATTITLPTTGIRVTGGSAGGSDIAGGPGSSFTVAGAFPLHIGGAGGGATTRPGDGAGGPDVVIPGLFYSYGGTGGGGTAAGASGAGLAGGFGGAGGVGSGGGGGGAAATASAVGVGGAGGPGRVIIISW